MDRKRGVGLIWESMSKLKCKDIWGEKNVGKYDKMSQDLSGSICDIRVNKDCLYLNMHIINK